MKVMIAGYYRYDIYENSLYQAFLQRGIETFKFSWGEYFSGKNNRGNLFNRFQEKYLIGPKIDKINAGLMQACLQRRPDLVFIYRGTQIFPSTVKEIKKAVALVFAYNNDDPFSKKYPGYLWRRYKASLKEYDWIFAYRKKNIDDYNRIAISNTSILKPYYVKEVNYFIENLPNDHYLSDVSFIGHYEQDGRDRYIKAILDAGINFRLYGNLWENSRYYDYFVSKLGLIKTVITDYNLALNSTRIALGFLSKINNDRYTRRSFEIPAVKGFMLSEYSDELSSIFKEGVEAEYFRSPKEMMDKINYYLCHEDERRMIAQAGYEALLHSHNEVGDRVDEIISIYKRLRPG